MTAAGDMTDVLIVGGGVIGLSIARELALAGLRVTVADRQELGREASWAGAGILPPAVPGSPETPLARLTRATHALWPALSEELLAATGIDNGFRRCGGLFISPSAVPVPAVTFRPPETAGLDEEIAAWREAGLKVELLDAAALKACEPQLDPSLTAAYRLPEQCQVRNPRHLKALRAHCEQLGVQLLTQTPVERLRIARDRVIGVETSTGLLPAGRVVIAAGAWSQSLLPPPPVADFEPVRGQILLLRLPEPPLRHVVECGSRYLVPRDDGRVLVGSTEERVGFEKQTTRPAMEGLAAFAASIAPILRTAEREREWAGLRPFTQQGVPYIGAVPHWNGLFLAAGHFRAGLHLSAITGRLMRELLTGQPLSVPY